MSIKPSDCAKLGPILGQLRASLLGAMDTALAPMDLTAAQVIVLRRLVSGPLDTPGELCRVLDYDRGAMSRLLDRIEAKGIIQRKRCCDDRRSVRIHLTDKGEALIPEIETIIDDIFDRAFQGFSVERRSRLIGDLQQMIENF